MAICKKTKEVLGLVHTLKSVVKISGRLVWVYVFILRHRWWLWLLLDVYFDGKTLLLTKESCLSLSSFVRFLCVKHFQQTTTTAEAAIDFFQFPLFHLIESNCKNNYSCDGRKDKEERQCDQLARLFVQYLAIYNRERFPIEKNSQSLAIYKIHPQNLLPFCQCGETLANFGHTADRERETVWLNVESVRMRKKERDQLREERQKRWLKNRLSVKGKKEAVWPD